MNPLLRLVFGKLIRYGNLAVIDPAGRENLFGNGAGARVTVRFTDTAAEWAVALNPLLKLGETYMDARLRVENCTINDFLALAMRNIQRLPSPWWMKSLDWLRYLTRRIHQYNPAPRAQRNVAHHYDLDGGLYELFLDSDRQYSCAYFPTGDTDLETAQLAKKRHLAAKLYLRDGQRVLDIGSGWGGLGLYLAKAAHVSVTGVTLSREQHKFSRERAQREGLANAVEFRLQDFRALEGPFERIVSVGMFEHVGVGHYREFFAKARELLTDDGVMVLHSIGRFDGPGSTNPWIDKYIFPGGYIPALSEVIPAIERSGLLVTDMEILRLHYAETLKAWRARFLANWDTAKALYDERFCRMWEFYLAASENAFRYQDMMVFQVQITKRLETLPLTRAYMFDGAETLRHGDSHGRRPGTMAGE